MTAHPPPHVRSHTRRRRAVQPLWTALQKCPAFAANGRLVLAVSGGADSRALMEAVAAWKLRDRLEAVTVISVDHTVRAEAASNAAAVVARAKVLGFDAELLRLVCATSTDEATLRQARYRRLLASANLCGATAVVTAHHQDDIAEGFLMGALGLTRALSPMLPSRPLSPAVQLVRPFLALPRATLRLALASLRGAGASVDEEDTRGRNSRARLRHRVVPVLTAVQPRSAERLATVARHFAAKPEIPSE